MVISSESETCKCFKAGNGIKWFNPSCPTHGFDRKIPEDVNSPKLPPKFEKKLREAFKDFQKK